MARVRLADPHRRGSSCSIADGFPEIHRTDFNRREDSYPPGVVQITVFFRV
jgi:hypothetical protein